MTMGNRCAGMQCLRSLQSVQAAPPLTKGAFEMTDSKILTKVVIALGGNALQSKESDGTAEAQLEVVKDTCRLLAELSAEGYEMAIVHGNGPRWDVSCFQAKRPRTWFRPCLSTYAAP